MKDEILFVDCLDFTTDHLTFKLLESDKEGKAWRVMIIKSGWSKNNIYYSADVLKKSRPLFEGCKVYAYQFKEKYFDHLPDDMTEIVKQGFARNLTGWLDKIKFEEVGKEKGLTGVFHVTDNFFRETFRNAWADGKKDLLGFSIDAKGELLPAVIGGRRGKRVVEIKKVNSTDIVTLPAAGGKLLRLVASMQQGEAKMNEQLKKLVEMIRENPELLGLEEGVNIDEKTDHEILDMLVEALNAREAKKKKKPDEEETEEAKKKREEEEKKKMAEGKEVKEMEIDSATLSKVLEMLKGKKIDEAMDLLSGILTAYKKKKYDYKKPKETETKEGEEKKPDEEKPDEAKKKTEEIDSVLEKLKVKESDMRLKEKLIDSDLPDFSKARIKSQYEGKVFEDETLKESIDSEKEYLAKISESDEVTGMGISLGKDKGDKLQIAMHKLLGVEPTDEEKPEWKDVPEFEGIKEAYIRWTGDRLVEGQKGIDRRITEAVSSDFPNALGTSMERRMVKEYSRVPIAQAWNKFVTKDNPNNYKTQDIIRIGGLGDLPIVAEDGAYTEFTTPSEEKASYNVAKRGKIFRITREMIKNDDLRTIRRIPVKMGQAAARTKAKFIFDLVINYGTGAINGGNIYDGGALYSAAHNNLTNSGLDTTRLDNAITAIANQTEADSGEVLGLQAAFLLVAYEKRSLAKVLIDSEKRPILSTVASEEGTVESINPNYKAVEPIIVPAGYLRNDTNNWYVLASPRDVEMVVVGSLDGRELPEILLQDSPTVDVVFTNDRIRYKIRHEYSGVVPDYRGLYAGIVAGLS